MTLTTLPAHLKPMVEKAALAMYGYKGWGHLEGTQTQEIARQMAEAGCLAFLNACLDGGVATSVVAYSPRKGAVLASTAWERNSTDHFPALILNLGEGK